MGQVEYTASSDGQPTAESKECNVALQMFKEHSLRIQKQDCAVTILHLSRLIQRHRGATLAMLGGDNSFQEQVTVLQSQVALQLDYLQYLNAEGQKPLPENDYQQLSLGWMTIIQDWKNDDLHQSFEFHSHLLESIARIARQLVKSVLTPSQVLSRKSALLNSMDKNYLEPLSELNQTCVVELYDLVEYLARIRGLGTHMAAMGHSNAEWESRVAFWLQEFRYRKERFDQDIQILPPPYQPCIPGLKALPNLNMKLNYFLNLLGHEMSSERSFQIPSHKLFLMGSEIIDGFLNIMDQANAVVRDQLYHMNHMCLERSVIEPDSE